MLAVRIPFTAAGRAVDAGEHHRVRLHAALFRIFLCRRQLGGKIAEEVVQHLFPLGGGSQRSRRSSICAVKS